MAKVFKVTNLYLVDVDDWYNNGEEVIEDLFEEDKLQYVFTAIAPQIEAVEFDWDEDHVFKNYGSSPIDCETWFQYYKHQNEGVKNETFAD